MSKKFYVKVHVSARGKVVAICDEELLGKKFENGEKQLDIKEDFYKGELLAKEDAIGIIKAESNINLVGKRIIEICINEGIINKEDVLEVKGVPYAMIFEI